MPPLIVLGKVLIDQSALKLIVEVHGLVAVAGLFVLGPRLEVMQSTESNVWVFH